MKDVEQVGERAAVPAERAPVLVAQGVGLHAWGNVVPACQECNAKKHGKEWHAYLVQRAGPNASERYQRVTEFVQHYEYAPDPADLRDVAEELYVEVGVIAVTLISEKVKRVRGRL